MAIAEWPTASGPADYARFVGITLVAVVEAKRKRKDVAGALDQADRYGPIGMHGISSSATPPRWRATLGKAAIAKLDEFHLLILDDIAYITKDQAETSVLFELIGTRYERRSLLITANQPFVAQDAIFPDPAMTLAAVDRLVHHATIFDMNAESYRRRSAEKARGPGRPRRKAFPADLSPD